MTTHRTPSGGDNGRAAPAGSDRAGRPTFGGLARWLRRGLVVATTTALGVAVGGLPAVADPQGLSISVRPTSVQLAVGGAARDLTMTVKNNSQRPAEGEVVLEVPLGDVGVRLAGAPGNCRANENAMRCEVPQLGPGRTASIRVKLAPPRDSDLAPGDKREGVGKATVRGRTVLDGQGEAQYQVLLSATDIVPEVAGKVIGPDDEPVPDAVIKIKDSDGNQHSTSTGSSGTFRFRASADKPLVPGTLQVVASKEGFQPQTKRVTGRGGQAVRDVRFSLLSASATPSETATDEEPAPTDGPATPADDAATAPAGKDAGLGFFGWFLIVMGVVLLGGGTVAIVLLLRRRDSDDGDDPDDRYPQHTGPIPTAAGAPGVYRSGGGSPPGGTYQTTAMPAQSPGMDAPTMLHERPFVEHVADASAASQAARARGGYDDPAGPRTQVHPARHDDYGASSDATQLHPGMGRHSTGEGDPYGSSGRHTHDDHGGYGAEGYRGDSHGGDNYGRGGDGYGRDGDGYGRGGDGYGRNDDGYGRGDDGYGGQGGGRHGADGPGRPDQGHGRNDDDGYSGRRRSVTWGDD